MPPIVIRTGLASGAAVGYQLPAGSGGFVAPNPEPNKRMVSPGLAGAKVAPAISPALPTGNRKGARRPGISA